MIKIIQGKFRILSNKKAGADYYKMRVFAPRIAKNAWPGQFVHLRCTEGVEPLLRRPFSFHRINQNNFEILYKVIGEGTNSLARKQKDDRIDVLGPLGNGFNLRRPVHSAQCTVILVAGGMGVAPLLAWAEKLLASFNKKDICVFIGAKTKEAILCASDFVKLGLKVLIATEDGSRGYKGLVTSLLRKILRTTHNAQRTTIYTCGPQPMLWEVARISQYFRMSAYASLEENIACGVGACRGCAIKTKAGYKLICKDGPVFDLQQIKWSKERRKI
jgi:dihydroorotate dehydrogenase electron transfer subunit